MARVVLTSAGTLGDHLPLIELGRALAARGHAVCAAFNAALHPIARAQGLDAAPCGRRFGAEEARAIAPRFDHWRGQPRADAETLARIDLAGQARDLLAACRDADLLIAGSLQAAAPLVHEALGLPWVTVHIFAADLRAGAPPARSGGGAAARPLTLVERHYNEVRAGLGLLPLVPGIMDGTLWSRRRLLATSPRFAPPPPGGPVVQCGFLLQGEPPATAWQPPPEVEAFLRGGSPPLLLTLSSLPLADRRAFLATLCGAAALLGLRLLVQSGWAGFTASDLPPGASAERVCLTDAFVPHAWLMPRVAAAIHHGGIGTTAQGLRAGCPMLVIPMGNDQVYNASRVQALGVGTAMHPHRLRPEGMARVLEKRVLAAQVRERAAALAAALAVEDGAGAACAAIEGWLREAKPGAASA